MNVICDRCKGPTKPKQITGKKDGKEYTVYECQGNCMNGRFKYSCFPPKEPKVKTQSNGETMSVLKDIAGTLRRIEKILANPDQVNIAESEMQPDEEAPF